MLSRFSALMCLTLVSSAAAPVETTQDSSPRVWTVTLSAAVDGSGVFHFTDNGLRYEHKHWSLPARVLFNGQPWNDLAVSPESWQAHHTRLDLSHAWVVRRSGRDTVAFEKSSKGFDVFLNDSPNGADDYFITIAIPLVDQTL